MTITEKVSTGTQGLNSHSFLMFKAYIGLTCRGESTPEKFFHKRQVTDNVKFFVFFSCCVAVIEVKGLSFKYLGGKDFALRGIDLEVEKGETILLVGPSGCGKSTLIRAINGLIPHRYAGEYKGSVTVSGVNVAESSPQALSRIVGTVMQEVSKQLVAQTVEDDVAFGPANLCMPREELRRRVEASLKAVGALHLRERDINALSGGEKQRVVFAGILAMDPEVVLLDEPLANLDSEGVRLVLERVEDFKQRGKTIVIAEHRTEEILEGVRVDRIIVMDKGVVLKELDSPEDLAEYRDKVRVPSSLIYSAQMSISLYYLSTVLPRVTLEKT